MASSSFNMSPYRDIWTHFKFNSVPFIKQCLDQVLDLALNLVLVCSEFHEGGVCGRVLPSNAYSQTYLFISMKFVHCHEIPRWT